MLFYSWGRYTRNLPMKNTLLNPIPATQTPETLQEALKLYQLIYMPSRNFSEKTRINYRQDLEKLFDFLERNGKSRLGSILCW